MQQIMTVVATPGLPADRRGIEQWFATAGLRATVVGRCPVAACAACRPPVPAAA